FTIFEPVKSTGTDLLFRSCKSPESDASKEIISPDEKSRLSPGFKETHTLSDEIHASNAKKRILSDIIQVFKFYAKFLKI
ncbi:MAG TPA: hypothetical protein PKM18_10480, partial [bacterium]|nr:hypothetical protein [bacterium]